MPVRLLIFLLCFMPSFLFAQQEQNNLSLEHDLELFEFLAMYDKEGEVFIDSEIENKSGVATVINQQDKMSESDE